MKVGISTASFFNKTVTESCFDVLRELRCDVTEVFLNSFYEYEKSFADALASRRGSVSVHSVHALPTQFEPELFNANARVRNDAEVIFRKVCYAGHVLGAKYYTFHGPLKLKNQPFSVDYERMGARLNQLIEIAETYGLKIAYENVHYSYFSEPEFFKNMSKVCPKLYATLDVKHAILAEQDVFDYVDAAGEKLATVHLCDIQKNNATALPGQGRINFDKFIKLLFSRSVVCPLILEVYPSDYTEVRQVCDVFNLISNCVKKHS
ncbi:MAG: sugar phosphate isomerase/epimerase [Firmicutes bacterium]|nr:sugar phosphate isomerase/epimerase [Bacillota bacterium]